MRTIAADGPFAMFAGREYRPPSVQNLGDAVKQTARGEPPKEPSNAVVVKVADIVSGTVKWWLGLMSTIIVFGIGVLVNQTLARSRELDEARQAIAIANANLANLNQIMGERFAQVQRQIDAIERRVGDNEEQVRLLWRR